MAAKSDFLIQPLHIFYEQLVKFLYGSVNRRRAFPTTKPQKEPSTLQIASRSLFDSEAD
jgi:hypothetical protein